MVRSEKTRRLIIEKTASIFNKKGYTGTYLSDLTNATGLTKGSIYGNFKDKNEVAIEAFRYNYKFQSDQLFAKIQSQDHAIDKLVAFLNHFRTHYTQVFNNGGCAILNTAVDADDGNEPLKNEVIQKINNWANTTNEILQIGIRKKEIQDINTMEFSHKIIALMEGSILLAKTLDQPEILLKNIDALEKEIQELRI